MSDTYGYDPPPGGGGGLLGALGDPMMMAYLSMIAKGLSPHSTIDPQNMLAQAQRQKQLEKERLIDAARRKEERDQRERFHQDTLNQQNRMYDLDLKRFDAGQVTPAVKAARDSGLTDPSSPEYRQFMTDWYKDQLAPKTVDLQEQVKKREIEADRLGLPKGSPQYQAYVLTGTLPRAPDLTATDKRALYSAQDEIPRLDQAITSLSRAEEITDQTFTGLTAGVRGKLGASSELLGGIMGGAEAAKLTDEWQKTMSQEALKEMSDTLKGSTAYQEALLYTKALADPTTPPETRKRMVRRMRTLFEQQKRVAEDRIESLGGKRSPQRSNSAPTPQRAPDGNYYIPDPNRPGKFLRVDP